MKAVPMSLGRRVKRKKGRKSQDKKYRVLHDLSSVGDLIKTFSLL